jgi:hypothetical protein
MRAWFTGLWVYMLRLGYPEWEIYPAPTCGEWIISLEPFSRQVTTRRLRSELRFYERLRNGCIVENGSLKPRR